MKIQDSRIILEFSEEVNNKEYCLDLANSYDLYTGAIENGHQYRAAKENNADILSELKENQVTSITFLNFKQMFSTEIYDKRIDL